MEAQIKEEHFEKSLSLYSTARFNFPHSDHGKTTALSRSRMMFPDTALSRTRRWNMSHEMSQPLQIISQSHTRACWSLEAAPGKRNLVLTLSDPSKRLHRGSYLTLTNNVHCMRACKMVGLRPGNYIRQIHSQRSRIQCTKPKHQPRDGQDVLQSFDFPSIPEARHY